MFKIVCPNCQKENLFQSKNNTPSECSFCWEQIPQGIQIVEQNENRDISGLTIIYQITQQHMEISTLHKVILGRENFGANVFSQILFNGKPVVSRKHCSLEFKEGNFYLLDEGSLNGTFYGVNKVSCKGSPQIVEDESIFYIGEEAFIAQINYKEEELNQEEKDVEKKLEEKNVIQFRCRGCGNNFGNLTDECPDCGKYNSLIPVYK
jgi:hypothetical protein